MPNMLVSRADVHENGLLIADHMFSKAIGECDEVTMYDLSMIADIPAFIRKGTFKVEYEEHMDGPSYLRKQMEVI